MATKCRCCGSFVENPVAPNLCWWCWTKQQKGPIKRVMRIPKTRTRRRERGLTEDDLGKNV